MTLLNMVEAAAIGLTTPGLLVTSWRAHRLTSRLHTDPLTGLANREALVRAFTRARRRETAAAVGVLLLDLDGFKQVNDQHGHDVGNQVLRHIATQLTAVTGPGELPVRLHGDEFAVLLGRLPGGRHAQVVADSRAQAVRAATAGPARVAGVEITATASVGAAVCATSHADLPALLRAADQRMYAAKPTHHRPTAETSNGEVRSA